MGNSCIDSVFAMLTTTSYVPVADSANEDVLSVALVSEGTATVTLCIKLVNY